MKIIFATNTNIWSLFIRWFTWSQYSHVALIKEDDIVEATFKHGVVQGKLDDFLARYNKTLICEVPNVDVDKAWDFAIAQLNKPYDVKSVFSLIFRRRWTDAEEWFCSELVAVALHKGGVTIIRKEASRVTPEDLLNSPLVCPLGE